MGSFRVPLQVSNPDNGHSETVNALVDTGAIYSMLPASMICRIGIAPIGKSPFVAAVREVVEYETSEAGAYRCGAAADLSGDLRAGKPLRDGGLRLWRLYCWQ